MGDDIEFLKRAAGLFVRDAESERGASSDRRSADQLKCFRIVNASRNRISMKYKDVRSALNCGKQTQKENERKFSYQVEHVSPQRYQPAAVDLPLGRTLVCDGIDSDPRVYRKRTRRGGRRFHDLCVPPHPFFDGLFYAAKLTGQRCFRVRMLHRISS